MKIYAAIDKDLSKDIWSCYDLTVKLYSEDATDEFEENVVWEYEGNEYDICAFLLDYLGYPPDITERDAEEAYATLVEDYCVVSSDVSKEDFLELLKAFVK